MSIKEFSDRLASLFYPDVTCYFCGEELTEKSEYKLCPACRVQMEKTKEPFVFLEGEMYASCCRYDGAARKLVLQAKDSDKSYLTQVMAAFLAEKIEESRIEYDVIAYVPASAKKIAKRGYDHMKLTAYYLSKRTKKPVLKGLYRVEEKADQTQVEKEKREENVRNSFVYKGENLEGKTVLLIDDVVSTGATTRSVKRALTVANPANVLFLTFTV